MDHDGFMDARISKNARHLTAGRVRKGHVGNEALSKKSGDAILGAVEKLIGNEKFPRTEVFL